MKSIFGQASSHSIETVIFPTPVEYNKEFNRSNDVARYDGYALYFSLDELTSYTFIHEYTHFRTELFCENNKVSSLVVPHWFGEGIAEYISYQYRKNKTNKPLEILKNFKEINNQTEFTNARMEGYDVYYQSYLSIKKS